MRILCQFVHSWTEFRVSELRAAAEAADVPLRIEAADLAELDASAASVFLWVHVPDMDALERLANRTVLVKRFVDVWASAPDFASLLEQLPQCPPERYEPYTRTGSTFKVQVECFNASLTDSERLAHISALGPTLAWKGKVRSNRSAAYFEPTVPFVARPSMVPKCQMPILPMHRRVVFFCFKVRMKNPQHTFVLLIEHEAHKGPGRQPRTEPRRLFFGREVSLGRRDVPIRYDLKRRNYIGTTSLDAELAVIMGNLARVRRGQLVYDPYVGTAGCLVGAAHFGAYVMGSDLFAPVLHGRVRSRSGKSKLTQAEVQGIGLTFDEYGFPPPVALLHADSSRRQHFWASSGGEAGGDASGEVGGDAGGDASGDASGDARGDAGGDASGRRFFDAIITDPPYGIRERSVTVDDPALGTLRDTLTEEQRLSHVPKTAQAECAQIFGDLFALARRTLLNGGYLVFLLPCTLPLAESLQLLPAHPGLELLSASEQCMGARWSRWCLVMRRTDRSGATSVAGASPTTAASTAAAAPLGGDRRDGGGSAQAGRAFFAPKDSRAGPYRALADAAHPDESAVLHPEILQRVQRRRESRQRSQGGSGETKRGSRRRGERPTAADGGESESSREGRRLGRPGWTAVLSPGKAKATGVDDGKGGAKRCAAVNDVTMRIGAVLAIAGVGVLAAVSMARRK